MCPICIINVYDLIWRVLQCCGADTPVAYNKQFDMMIYPNQHHNLDDVQLHVFTRITNYFLEQL